MPDYQRDRKRADLAIRDRGIVVVMNARYDPNDLDDPMWDKLAELTEEATGQPKDLCLYNSDKDTFDNGIATIDYDNGVRACYILSVVSSRTTRQMSLIGTKGSAQGDLEECMIKLIIAAKFKVAIYVFNYISQIKRVVVLFCLGYWS